MPSIRKRKSGPRGPRLDYAQILTLLSEKPILSYQQIATKVGCSLSSVSTFANLPSAKRKALAAASASN